MDPPPAFFLIFRCAGFARTLVRPSPTWLFRSFLNSPSLGPESSSGRRPSAGCVCARAPADPADPAGVVRGALDSLQPGTWVGARPARRFKPPILGRVVTQHGQRTRRRWPGAWGVFPRTGKDSGIVSPAERRAAAAQTPGEGPWEPPLAPALDPPAESRRGLALRDTAPGPGPPWRRASWQATLRTPGSRGHDGAGERGAGTGRDGRHLDREPRSPRAWIPPASSPRSRGQGPATGANADAANNSSFIAFNILKNLTEQVS